MSKNKQTRLSAVKHALLSSQLRMRADDLDLLASEPIAIIGTGCRLPGGVDSASSFWELLESGTDAITEIPASRWNRDEYFDADPSAPGKINTLYGGFLEGIELFDPRAFGIAPREARYIDPQHRLLLQVAWEACDDSGYPLASIRGSRTGIFFGLSNSDYGRMQLNRTLDISAHTLSGTAPSVAAGRLSYLFDLRGPSMVIDTACSSSLVAVHTGVQSLRNRESNIAIAGGVSLNIMPEETISLAKWGMLAPDGRCKTFDAQANGFVRSEGCGLVVLKRLSDALRDHDTVRAVIRGSAINQDGRSNVLTAPNGEAQRNVISAALRQAGTKGSDISFVETHGTGTKVGDPIEVESLIDTVGQRPAGGVDCYLGAVKANLGHLEAAAGVVGLIKLVLCLQHRSIPPQVHFQKINPLVSLDGTGLRIPKKVVPWEASDAGRVAGLSSFGFSGTNVHMIVEEAPNIARAPAGEKSAVQRHFILPLSAKQWSGVSRISASYVQLLQQDVSESEFRDICFSAGMRRSHFAHRYAAVGSDAADIGQKLSRFIDASTAPMSVANPKIGFVFSGQGSYWHGMARVLLKREAVFAEAIKECDAEIQSLAGWSILDEINARQEAGRLDQTVVFQPVVFAIQIGLARLWDSWGIRPSAVTGHSVGEVAAAHTAGILTLPNALRLVELRSRLMQEASGDGAMAAVAMSIEELRERTKDRPALSVAASNSPSFSTLSGESRDLSRMLAVFEKEDIFCRRLDVACAFHSEQMEPFVRPLVDGLADMEFSSSRVQFFSTVSGAVAGSGIGGEFANLDPAYWGRNLRDPVLFSEAILAMMGAGCTAFVEIGPHSVLLPYVAEMTGELELPRPVFASMRRDHDDDLVMKEALAGLYGHGCNPDWDRIVPAANITPLPNYPWEKDVCWLDWRSADKQIAPSGEQMHPLLGSRIDSPAIEQVIYEQSISAVSPSYLADHRIGGVCILPAAAMIEMMLGACHDQATLAGIEILDCPVATICDFNIESPMILPQGRTRRIQLVVQQAENNTEMSIYSRAVGATDDWVLHASANCHLGLPAGSVNKPSSDLLERSAASTAHDLDVDEFYVEGRRIGVDFGPAFCSLSEISVQDGCAIGRVGDIAESFGRSHDYILHPLLLDGCLQVIDAAVRQGATASALLLPVAIERIECLRSWHGNANVIATLVDSQSGESERTLIDARVDVTDDEGVPIIAMRGVRMKITEPDALMRLKEHSEAGSTGKADTDAWIYRVNWQREALPPKSQQTEQQRQLVICTNQPDICHSLIASYDTISPSHSTHVLSPLDCPIETTVPQYVVEPLLPESFVDAIQQIRNRAHDQSQPADMDVLFLWDLTPNLPGYAEASGGSHLDSGKQRIAAALHLLQALTASSDKGQTRTWLVSRGGAAIADLERCVPAQAAIWGLGISAQTEHPELNCVLLDLDPDVDVAADAHILCSETGVGKLREDRLAYRSKQRYVARLSQSDIGALSMTANDRNPFRVCAPDHGVFDDLAREDMVRRAAGPGQVEIRTAALGINFRDVLNALNEIAGPDGRNLGAECAGEIIAIGDSVEGFEIGDKVAAFAMGGFASHITVSAELVAQIPTHIDMIDAAGIPVVFLTATYAFTELAKLRAGQSVLIHAAAGGVGLAAVRLAQKAHATIFATAGSPEKRNYLRQLGIENVFDSRSTLFTGEILAATNGDGVDVLLNSLAGEFIPAGMSVVRPGGLFIELGKRDDWDSEKVATEYPGIEYRRFDLGEIASTDGALISKMFNAVMGDLDNGELQPLPTTIFPLKRVSDAFRYMAQGKHIGKLIVPVPQYREKSTAAVIENASYLITGGLGALGMDIAEKLVSDGARQLVLIGRSKGSPETVARIEKLRATGAEIRVEFSDVADFDSLRELFDRIDSEMRPLRGVIHCAGVLRDAAFTRQTWDKFQVTMRPKIDGAWNLHALTRTRKLDFFVLFSSAAAILGWPGQASYAVGNAYMDALAHYRRARGQTALSINWGVWADAGMADKVAATRGDSFSARGLLSHTVDKAVKTFTELLQSDAAQVMVGNFDWARFSGRFSVDSRPGFYEEVCDEENKPRHNGRKEGNVPIQPILRDLENAPAGQRMRVLTRFIEQQTANVLGLSAGQDVDRKVPLNEQGLDSLLAVELRNALSAALGARFPATMLFDYPTINLLSEHIGIDVINLTVQTRNEAASKPDSEKDQATLAADIGDMAESEAERLLQQELEDLTVAHRK